MAIPAKEIINRLGGQTKLAEGLGVTQSAVSRWASRGRIPAERWEDVIRYADGAVTLDELMPEGLANAVRERAA